MYTGVILQELPGAENTYWSVYSKDNRSRECTQVALTPKNLILMCPTRLNKPNPTQCDQKNSMKLDTVKQLANYRAPSAINM